MIKQKLELIWLGAQATVAVGLLALWVGFPIFCFLKVVSFMLEAAVI